MAFLYKVLTGTVNYQGLEIKGKMSMNEISGLEAYAAAGIVGKEQVAESSLVAAANALSETVSANRLIKKSTGKAVQMYEGDSSGCIGASLGAAGVGEVAPYLKGGFLAVDVGDMAITDGQSIVAGAHGKAVPYLSTGYTILNEASIAGDDITQTGWGSAGSQIYVATSVDVEDDRGKEVTFYFLNEDGVFTIETVQIDTTSSATQAHTAGICTVLMGYEPSEAFSGTLVIKDEDGNTAKSIATPSAIKYGFLAASDTSADAGDTNGHRVLLTCSSGAVTGDVVVEWLTDSDETVYETVNFAAATTGYTVEAYRYFVGMYVADDGRTTATWTATIDANTSGQIVGIASGAVAARGTVLIDFKTPEGQIMAIPMSIIASITQGQNDYTGPTRSSEATTEIDFFVVPYDGTIEGLFVTLETAASGTNYTTCTVRKNKADTAMIVTITGTAVAGNAEGSSYAFAVSAGDKIGLKVAGTQPTGGYAAANLNATVIYKMGV